MALISMFYSPPSWQHHKSSQTTMLARLERMIDSGDKAAHAFAEREVAALTKIRNGKFKSTFNREADTTFTGKHGERSGWAKLSAKAQESYNRPSFFDRLFGRTLPSQHSEKVRCRPTRSFNFC